tara:strand:+ start:237 stop:1610 length:1374 start_codon:yes stop_codon:yes gene_type:complete
MGTGVDIQKLAEDLAKAETQPKIDRYEARKEKSESSISGYSALSAAVNEVQTVLDALANKSSARQLSVSGSTVAIEAKITSQAAAGPGTSSISVQQLAQPKVIRSVEFNSKDAQINGGTAFNVTITKGGVNNVVSVATTTPTGIADAVNKANLGVMATVVNNSAAGNAWYIQLTGDTGLANDFSVSTTAPNNSVFAHPTPTVGSTAQDSRIVVNGLTVNRKTNTIDDVIPGMSLSLKQLTGDTNANIIVSEDKTALKDTLDLFVTAVNNFSATATDLTTEGGENSYSGSLSNDKSFVNLVSRKIKNLVDKTSSTPSGGIDSFRDIGMSFTLAGNLYIDEKAYNSAVTSNYSSIVSMLTADTENQSKYDGGNKGLSLDSSIELDTLVGTTGSITRQSSGAQTKVDEYADKLLELEQKLLSLQQKYIKQFASMESLVQKSKDTRTYLEGQFESMSNMYK